MADFCFLIGAFALSFASLCSVLALSLDLWESGDVDYDALGPIRIHYVSVQAGLWHEHRTFHRSSIFIGIPDNSSRIVEGQMYTLDRDTDISKDSGIMLLIVRILLFVSTLSLFGAVLCVMLKSKVFKTTECLSTVPWILACPAGACLLSSFVIYMKGLKAEGTDFYVAFYLDIIGWILAWLSSCLLFLSSRTFRNLVNG